MENKKYDLDEICRKMDEHAASSESPEQIVKSCFDEIIAVMKPERGFIELYDSESDKLNILSGYGIEIENFSFEAVSFTILDKVFKKQAPVLTVDAMMDKRFEKKLSVVLSGLRSSICAPLKTEKGLVGLIYIDERKKIGHYKKSDLRFIEDCCKKLSEIITQKYPDLIPRQPE